MAEVTEEAIDKGVASLAERATRYEAGGGPGGRRRRPAHHRFLPAASARRSSRAARARTSSWWWGRSRFIPGFVEGLAGAKAGEERAVNVKFPDDYPEQKLAGKDAVFAVKVKEVAKAIKPELNDEFAKTLGAETLAKLRELVAARSPASTCRSRA